MKLEDKIKLKIELIELKNNWTDKIICCLCTYEFLCNKDGMLKNDKDLDNLGSDFKDALKNMNIDSEHYFCGIALIDIISSVEHCFDRYH